VAVALIDQSLDGQILNITGSESNTLTAENMRLMIEEVTGKKISYKELPLPESPEMKGLWIFLRAKGIKIIDVLYIHIKLINSIFLDFSSYFVFIFYFSTFF
jgi:hypothetical protein